MATSTVQDQVEQAVVRRATTFDNLPLARFVSVLRGASDLKYWPLRPDEIRVLCLEPGNFDSPLQCRLKHIRLPGLRTDQSSTAWEALRSLFRRARPYEAISYAWGQAIFDKNKWTLHIKGHGHKPITQSLYEALKHLRSRHTTRRLWADAVCIDQLNNSEVTAQVKNMSTIFGSASRVLIWLGPARPSDVRAFAALTTLDKHKSLKLQPENFLYTQMAKLCERMRHCHCCRLPLVGKTGDISAECIRAIVELLDRPWFSRMWVLQEVLCASNQELCVGTHHVHWKTFLLILGALHRIALHKDNECDSTLIKLVQQRAYRIADLSAIFLPRRDARNSGGQFFIAKVLDNMSAFSSFGCSKSQDRIFAARPILQIENMPALEPNYTIRTHEVYRRLTCACLAAKGVNYGLQHRGYEFFALAGTVQSPGSGPSWVPNFDSFTQRSRHKHRQYTCLPYTKNISTFEEEPTEFLTDLQQVTEGKLKVRGRSIGTIQELWPDCSWPEWSSDAEDFAKVVCRYADWYRRCQEKMTFASLDSQQVRTFLTHGYSQMMFRDKIVDGDREYQIHKILQDQYPDLVQEDRENVVYIVIEVAMHHNPLDGLHIVVDCDEILARVALDDQDIVAWVPKTAKKADDLYCLSGAPYPFVTRVDAAGTEIILGDAYTMPLTFVQVFGESCQRLAKHLQGEIFRDWNGNRTRNRGRQDDIERLLQDMPWVTLV